MLVLTRKQTESIVIADNIVVVVKHIGHGRVQLAIDAPREVKIVRSEIVGRDKE